MNMLTALNEISLGEAGVLGALGYGIVFVGLIALMIVVIIIGKAFSAKKNETAAPAAPAPAAPAAPAAAPVVVTEVAGDVAPGSAGHLKIHDVPPKTAAMLMAIVADKMGKPLNELRFISIKEVM